MIQKLVSYLKKTNKVLMYLTFSDVSTWGSYTIISALSGLYLANKLGQDVVEFIGIGTAIYFITRGLFPLPIGFITDKFKRDTDEIVFLFIGVLLMGMPFIFYPLVSQAYHYYILQFVFGLGTAFNVTNWRKLFTLNIDKGREGTNYAKYDTIMSLATAVLCVLGGYIANLGDAYFDIVMVGGGIVMMSSSFWISMIYRDHKRKSFQK